MKQRVSVGEVVTMTIGHSEVCMHLRVAGQRRKVQVLDNGAQILNDDGSKLSFPVTHGEAGLYRDDVGLYLSL